MRLLTFSLPNSPDHPQPGLLLDEHVLPLPHANMLELIEAGPSELVKVQHMASQATNKIPLSLVRLHAPITHPPTLRDFYAFEQHVRTAFANRGREVPPEWYQVPVFYYSNPGSLLGPEDILVYPSYSQALDYELEIACIIGKAGINISPEQAAGYIFGFTIFNDWSARDVQRQEMAVGLGPAKGKDFASSLGPWIVTPDELDQYSTDRAGVYDLEMCARVNGTVRSQGNFKEIHYSFTEMIVRSSAGAWLHPGDVLGSGTVGSGCLLELTRGQGPWLQPGDLVELEIEQIGILRNRIKE